MPNLRAHLFTGTLLFGLLPGGAMAIDATAFGERVKALYGPMGYQISFAEAREEGNDVVLAGLSMILTGLDEPVTFDSPIRFEEVSEDADGSYRARAMTIPDMAYEIDDAVIEVKNFTYQNVFLSSAAQPGVLDMMQIAGGFSVGPVTVTADDRRMFTIPSISATSAFDPAQGGALRQVESTLTIPEITFHLSNAPEQPDGMALVALGVANITGRFVETAGWTLEDGHLDVETMKFEVDNMGSLDIGMDLNGFTPALFDQILALNAQIDALEDTSEEEQEKAAIAIGLSLLSQITVNSMSIRYEDAGLARRLIVAMETQAGSKDTATDGPKGHAKRNTGGQTLTEQVMAHLAEPLGAIGSPALTRQVEIATEAFIANPQSIEISVAPSGPLPAMAVVAAAMAPAILVDMLGLSVTANQPPAR